jgi:hypothetical protein
MAYLGLLKRRECWTLSGPGWAILCVISTSIIVLTITNIHSFLSANHPVHAELLVVEGWLPDYALEKAMSEFNANNYNLLVITGEPLSKGSRLLEYKTSAHAAAATMKKLGFDEESMVVVTVPLMRRDRTFASALAFRKWLLNSELSVKAINIFSLGAHARRSRLLFEKTLGNKLEIGVIAAENLRYDPHNWWRSSVGVQTIIGETIAYIYTKLFFYPKVSEEM